MFCTFWLRNVLRATTACTFSTSQLLKVVRSWGALYILTWKCVRTTTVCTFRHRKLPKVFRSWGALYILTWKCASRHNGVHFFDIATSKSVPKLRSFLHFDLEMCFAPQRRAIFHLSFGQLAPHLPLWRAYFSTSGASNHWRNYLFAHLDLLLLTLSLSSSLLFPDSSHVCFWSVHIVGSLTSKLPSIRWYFYGISLGCPWYFYWIPMIFLWYFERISLGFPWGFFGISMMVLWYFYWIPVGFPWYFYDISMGLLWGHYGV